MAWTVAFHPEFEREFDALDPGLQDEMLAHFAKLAHFGPSLGRPSVDTLHAPAGGPKNLKELRLAGPDGGVWRIAFAFDPARAAILLVAGDKRGQNERRFYARLITVALHRLEDHLTRARRTEP